MTENKEKNVEDKIDQKIKWLAGVFALLGIFAIIYKLYQYGTTENNVIEAIITLSQILTATSVVFISIEAIIKNKNLFAREKFKKSLQDLEIKYHNLIKEDIEKERRKNNKNDDNDEDDYEEKEEASKKDNNDSDIIYLKMLKNHNDILSDFVKSSGYATFVKIPTKIAKQQIIFTLPKTMINEKVENNKGLEKVIESLIALTKVLKENFPDIIKSISIKSIEEFKNKLTKEYDKKIITFNRKGKATKTFIHIYLKDNLEESKKNYNDILNMLDFVIMSYLAIA